MSRRDWLAAAGVVLFAGAVIAGFLFLGLREMDSALYFPLDDAWIHVRFAQNLVERGEFAFNPGEPMAGSTSPLWVALLAGLGLAMRDYVVAALALGMAGYLLAVLATWYIARRAVPGPLPAVIAALIVAVNVRMCWGALSGMEICLAAFLSITAAGLYAAEEAEAAAASREEWYPERHPTASRLRYWGMPVVFGLAALTRPEVHLLFGLAVILRLFRRCRRGMPVKALLQIFPYQMVLVYAVVVLPWHAFNMLASGSALPNTFWANFRGLMTQAYPPGFQWRYLRWVLFRDHPWVYWLGVVGILTVIVWSVREVRRGWPPESIHRYGLVLGQLAVLWVIFFPLVSRALIPSLRHHGRYMIPLTPFHAILAVYGMMGLIGLVDEILEGRRRWKGRMKGPLEKNLVESNTVWVAIALLVVLTALPYLYIWAGKYGRNVYSINHQHVAIARWINTYTDPDAVVATHDIGAIGAIGDRRVIDIFGLVTPEMLQPSRTLIPTAWIKPEWYMRQLAEMSPDYVVGYPEWLPFAAGWEDCFTEVKRAVLAERDIAGGFAMVVYRVDNEELKRAAANL